MGKRKKKLLITVFVMSFITAMSLLWTPQVQYTCDTSTFEPLTTLDYDDVSFENQCLIDKEGNVEVSGPDPHLVFADLGETGRMVKLNFKEPLQEDTEIELFVNQQWGFNEAQKVEYNYTKGETSVCFLLGDHPYIELRLDVDLPYQLESVQLGNVEVVETNVTDDSLWFVWTFIIALASTGLVYWLEEKYAFVDRLAEWLNEKKRRISQMIPWILGMGVVSGIIALLWGGLPAFSLYGIYCVLIQTAFVFLILCAILYVWSCRDKLVENFEKIFAVLLLIAGCTMILVSPLAHLSWDTENHYKWAMEASYLGDAQVTRSDILITTHAADSLIKVDPYGNFLNMGVLTVGYQDVVTSYEGEISLAHLPSGIFIALGRLLGLPFMFIYMLGKVPNLLIYTALCYFALKKLKSGKLILAVIALLPTNVFLACNYSYDYWVTGFSLLGMAYFVGALQENEKVISTKDAFIMCVSFGLACVPKLIYFPILLIPFLMPGKKIDSRKKYYALCSMAFVVLVMMFLVESLAQTTGAGDLRGGSTVGPADQIAFILGDIFGYANILINFLFKEYLTLQNAPNYISNYAYIGVANTSMIFLVMMLVTFLFDRNEAYTKETKSNWLCRVYVVLMFFGGCALCATALYVAYTPVGHGTVLGCQARYMIPWLYPLLSVLSMNMLKPVIKKEILYWTVIIGCFGTIFYDLYTVFIPRVVSI